MAPGNVPLGAISNKHLNRIIGEHTLCLNRSGRTSQRLPFDRLPWQAIPTEHTPQSFSEPARKAVELQSASP